MRRPSTESLEPRVLFSAYVVDTLDDTVAVDGFVSLREAITAANTNAVSGDAAAGEAGEDSITFDSSLNNGTIRLTQGQLLISGGIQIDGQGHNLTVDGNAASRVFEVNTPDFVRIANLTVANGLADTGGGIYLSGGAGTTVLDALTIRDNTAATLGGGGVVNVDHTLTLQGSILTGNVAFNLVDGNGGAVLLGPAANTTIYGSLISGNFAQRSGGGVSSVGDTVIDRSTINNNAVFGPGGTDAGGGGVANFGTMLISGSLIKGNSVVEDPGRAGGGVFSSGATTITASRVNENGIYGGGHGGGVAVASGTLNVFESRLMRNRASGENAEGGAVAVLGNSTVLIDGSLLERNRADRGGAVRAPFGNITFNQSIVFNNRAHGAVNGDGGGIYANGAAVRVLGSDISGNRAAGAGGGILLSGTLEVADSTIENNVAGGSGGGMFLSNANWTVDNAGISFNASRVGDGNAGGGGIAAFGGTGSIVNAAVFANQTLGNGGGIYNAGALSLTTVDITRNIAATGGGIFNDTGATLTRDNTTFIFRNFPNNSAGLPVF